MEKKSSIPRPLHASMNDCYTKRELLAICERELFAPAKHMDISLLKEALYALDERPDEEAAPHRAYLWAKICERTRATTQRSARKTALLIALIVLLLALAGGCLAWALRAGVLSFPSLALPWLPSVETDAAQSLVQRDLFAAQYEHCELRVREAALDGHQLRIVYSLRDTRENAALTDDDQWQSSIAAAQLDGIGSCDALTLDGEDVYLDEIFQLPSEGDAEMLYYLSASIPQETELPEIVTVQMPIGELDLQTGKRLHEEVCFPLDTTKANSSTRKAQSVAVVWDGLRVEIARAEFSPLSGMVEVRYGAAEEGQPFEHVELHLFAEDGTPVGHERLPAYGGDDPFAVDQIITQYVPIGEWPEKMVLAPALEDGSMDASRLIPLSWEPA